MGKRVRQFLQWMGVAETLRSIGQAELLRTVLWPAIGTMLTGGAGIMGGVPLMWVFMASAVSFAGITTGLLRGSEYIQRKHPLNKLAYLGTHCFVDLIPAELPLHLFGNRHDRRAMKQQQSEKAYVLSGSEIMHGVNRKLDKAQIGITLQNNASFPISCFMESAETELQGIKPPRGTFPRDTMTMLPGNKITFKDDRINMDGMECGNMSGTMDMTLKYGLPGKERLELRFRASLEIQLQSYGQVVAVHSHWLD